MGRIIFKVPESKHPFVGMGEGVIVTENGRMEPKIVVKFPQYGIEITTIEGEKAKDLISRMSSEYVTNDDKVEYAKSVACDVLSIDRLQLSKSQSPKPVFGRWLIWDYANKNLEMSYSDCGRLFNMGHAAVMTAIKNLRERMDKDNRKYMEDWQQSSYILFKKEMEIYISIFQI